MFGAPPPLSKRVFDKYDKDKSGYVSDAEFGSLCYEMGYHLSKTELETAIATLDKDGNGSISYDEFKSWWTSDNRFSGLKLTEEEQETLQSCIKDFRSFDKDGSGTLSRAEFSNLHAKLIESKLTAKSIDRCFDDLDHDGGGSISFNEYVSWLTREGALKVRLQN